MTTIDILANTIIDADFLESYLKTRIEHCTKMIKKERQCSPVASYYTGKKSAYEDMLEVLEGEIKDVKEEISKVK